MFELTVNVSRIEVTKPDILTSGRVGHKVHFRFANNWEGLTKIAVFEAGERSRIVNIIENDEIITIPWEVLEFPDLELKVAVRGATSDSQTVIPTLYASLGYIHRGADITGGLSASLEPYTLDSLAAAIEEMKLGRATLTTERYKLVNSMKNPSSYLIEGEPREYSAENPPPKFIRINLNDIPLNWAKQHINNLYIGVEHCFRAKGTKYHWEQLQDINPYKNNAWGWSRVNICRNEELQEKPDFLPNNGLLQAKIKISMEDIERGYILFNPYVYFLNAFWWEEDGYGEKIGYLIGTKDFQQRDMKAIKHGVKVQEDYQFIEKTVYIGHSASKLFKFNLYYNDQKVIENSNTLTLGINNAQGPRYVILENDILLPKKVFLSIK